MGPTQLTEVLRHLPIQSNPDLLVGFDTRDDAGVLKISDDLALVQTLDFFTPILDDPYWYGAIAAANALSDVYAMGGVPLTVMNIACFDPSIAPPQVWADVLQGAYDKTREAGAVVVGGHSVMDSEPKFGLSVTGTVHPDRIFSNKNAKPGDRIWLSKPIGTGIATTAAKSDACPAVTLQEATEVMATLNRQAAEAAHQVGCRCATDITGFGLAGHLFNIARASDVTLRLNFASIPLLQGILELVEEGFSPGGTQKNYEFVQKYLCSDRDLPEFMVNLLCDPQTSGGLAVFSPSEVEGSVLIGEVLEGAPKIIVDQG